nr:hypothetical protein CFP56_42429 [Quercus suber]
MHGQLSFDRFMVRDLSDLEVHNPHSPTNDSLWEANFLANTDEEIDPSNAAVNTTMQQTSDQAIIEKINHGTRRKVNGLSVRQLSDPRIHSIAALPNQHACTEVMMHNSSSSFNKLLNQKPKKPSPKRQRCDDAQVISSPHQRRIDQHQWILGNETQRDSYNQAEEVSTVIAALQCTGIENNELIIRIRFPDTPNQHREPSLSWNNPPSQQLQASLMLSQILHLLSNLGLSEAAHERPPKQP